MLDLRVLIAAAGTGSRAGLPYPKVLHPVRGRPILVQLMSRLRDYDAKPLVVISPSGRAAVAGCLDQYGLTAQLVEQANPTGMGDAILRYDSDEVQPRSSHLLIVWGDIPLLGKGTVDQLVERHFTAENDFTFVTRVVENAYTVVHRDPSGAVVKVEETRELAVRSVPGERDVGLFVIRVEPVFRLLRQRLSGAIGTQTGEHGFLYIVRHLVEHGLKVEGLPIATENDVVSLNYLSDIESVHSSSKPPAE